MPITDIKGGATLKQKSMKVFVYEKGTNNTVYIIKDVKRVEMVWNSLKVISKTEGIYIVDTKKFKTTIYQN